MLLTVSALLIASCDTGKKYADAASSGAATSATSKADEEAIRGQVDRWLQLVKSKDAAAIAKLYTEDGAVMPPNSAIDKGRTAIQQTWAAMMSTPGFDLMNLPEQIIVSGAGDMALDRGTYRLAMAPSGNP